MDEQGRATQEIATQVQEVAQQTERATRSMLNVSTTAEKSGATSHTVLVTADEVTLISNTLREEVDHFVTTMQASEKSDDRRKYERIPGLNAKARLRSTAHGLIEATIIDISLGGAALSCAWSGNIGDVIMIRLPGFDIEVSARAVKMRDHVLAVSFKQDPSTISAVGQAIDKIAAST